MKNTNQTKNSPLMAALMAATGATPLNLNQLTKVEKPSDKVEFTEEEKAWLATLHRKAKKVAVETLKAKHRGIKYGTRMG